MVCYMLITTLYCQLIELVCEMEVQQAMWNEAVKLVNDIETQLLCFRSILEVAYDHDTRVQKHNIKHYFRHDSFCLQEPKQRMLGIANELLDTFECNCLQRCLAPRYGEDEEESSEPLMMDYEEDESEESERESEGEEGEAEDGDDDDTHKNLPSTMMSKVYCVLEFKLSNHIQ